MGTTQLLRIYMALARTGLSLKQTLTGTSSSVQTFAVLVAGAQALSMPMGQQRMALVPLTLEVTATFMRTKTAPIQAQIGSAASKFQVMETH